MNFIHTPYQPDETIAAISTPPGEGGVAMIRISGKDSLKVAKKVFSKDPTAFKSHTAHHGHILDLKGEKIDEVLLLPMLQGRSYTGEDTVEIFCHGGSLITRKVLERVIEAGARQALPGEFTFKAYMNGKIDLAQAEAVQSLIHAKNENMLVQAEKQLEGRLSKLVLERQSRLTQIAAILEAWIDFPDEGLEFEPMEKVVLDLKGEVNFLNRLIQTYHDGKILSEGLKVALIGRPNVGKSSLMNALLDKERAIVSDIAGTTRDILEDHLKLNGMNILLTDTAGIRDSSEVIEKEGIKRSKKAMEEADLVLFVLDSSSGFSLEDRELIESTDPMKSIVIYNKCDLNPAPTRLHHPHTVSLSALHKTGLEELKEMIDKVVWKKGPPSKEEIIITHIRHEQALKEASEFLQKVIQGLESGISPEFVSFDMKGALKALGKIIGMDITEDVLTSVFKQFCIGK